MYTFEIDENNAVKIFKEGQEAPMIFQPDWPNGTPWANAAEATTWAEVFIANLEDPEYAFMAGYGPEEPKLPKPVAPEVPAAE
jgi:hypothetical protein